MGVEGDNDILIGNDWLLVHADVHHPKRNDTQGSGTPHEKTVTYQVKYVPLL